MIENDKKKKFKNFLIRQFCIHLYWFVYLIALNRLQIRSLNLVILLSFSRIRILNAHRALNRLKIKSLCHTIVIIFGSHKELFLFYLYNISPSIEVTGTYGLISIKMEITCIFEFDFFISHDFLHPGRNPYHEFHVN